MVVLSGDAWRTFKMVGKPMFVEMMMEAILGSSVRYGWVWAARGCWLFGVAKLPW